jgi:hypothetical protein
MRAVIVSVEYGDILNITLPYNRHHFEEVLVITTPQDDETIRVARRNNARIHLTRAFYDGGAIFNKWKALEEGLSAFGRWGILALMDADIMWPKSLPEIESGAGYERGYLYGPYRYLWKDLRLSLPPEAQWRSLQRFKDFEFPGYTQIFHADDPHLPFAPWHEIDWVWAGGADSAFQNLWPPERRYRLSWPTLHLGVPFQNWAGRASDRVDGSLPALAATRRDTLYRLLSQRRNTPNGIDYSAERLAR